MARIFLIVAVICFALATLGVKVGKVDLIPAGLLAFALSFLV